MIRKPLLIRLKTLKKYRMSRKVQSLLDRKSAKNQTKRGYIREDGMTHVLTESKNITPEACVAIVIRLTSRIRPSSPVDTAREYITLKANATPVTINRKKTVMT